MAKEKVYSVRSDDELLVEEKYAVEAVPHSIRGSWVKTAAIYSGMVASISWCMTGGSLISSLSFVQSLLSLAIGMAVLIICICLPMGKIGTKHGFNTYIIGECAFGSKGSNIATGLVISAIPCIAWYGIQVTIAAQAVTGALNMGTSATNILALFFGVLFVIPTLLGTKSMAWLNYVSIPLMIFILVFGVYRALQITGSADALSFIPATQGSVLWGVNLQIGMVICGSAFIADYSRWQKDSMKGLIGATTLGMYPFSLVLTAAGMIMAISAVNLGVADPWNPVSVMMAIGMPTFALLLIFLLQWTTCVTSIYSSSLALVKFFGGKRWVWSFVSSAIGVLLAITGIVNYFMTFLNILAIWLSPVVGVIIAEYYFVSKGELKRKSGFYWPGLVCWLLGGLVGWLANDFLIPAINSLVVSGVLYLLYHMVVKPKQVSAES